MPTKADRAPQYKTGEEPVQQAEPKRTKKRNSFCVLGVPRSADLGSGRCSSSQSELQHPHHLLKKVDENFWDYLRQPGFCGGSSFRPILQTKQKAAVFPLQGSRTRRGNEPFSTAPNEISRIRPSDRSSGTRRKSASARQAPDRPFSGARARGSARIPARCPRARGG